MVDIIILFAIREAINQENEMKEEREAIGTEMLPM